MIDFRPTGDASFVIDNPDSAEPGPPSPLQQKDRLYASIAASGLVLFLAVAGLVSFNQGLFSKLYPKSASHAASTTSKYFGVNVAGAEFNPGKVPGVEGTDYVYSSTATGYTSYSYFAGKNLTLIRIPFLWERVQPQAMGALSSKDVTDLGKMLTDAQNNNEKVILDLHNYARYNGVALTTADAPKLADVWQKLAQQFNSSPALWGYEIMNEPHDLPEGNASWTAIAQAAVNSIRQVDATHNILIPGVSWQSANQWPSVSDDLKNITDPTDPTKSRIIYAAHQYFDTDGSGTYTKGTQDCTDPNVGVNRVTNFTNWLATNNAKGIVTEYGVPTDTCWLTVLDNFMNKLSADDHIVGGTYWAAGPWWGSYPLSIQPTKDGSGAAVDRAQMSIVSKYPTQVATSTPTPTPPLSPTPAPTPGFISTITFDGVTSNNNGTGANSLTLFLPSGAAVGDVLISQVVVHGAAATTLTSPSGWVLVRRDNTASSFGSALYQKIVGTHEPISASWTFNSTQPAAGGMAAYGGVDTTAPIDTTGFSYNISTATMTAPSITTASTDQLLFMGSIGAVATVTSPTGMTSRWTSSASNVSSYLADQSIASAGATGTRVGTSSASGVSNITQIVALKPASANPSSTPIVTPIPTQSITPIPTPLPTLTPTPVPTPTPLSLTRQAAYTATPTAQTNTANWKNDLVYITNALTLKEIASYSFGSGQDWELWSSTSSGTLGTILVSGTLNTTKDSSGYFTASLNKSLVAGYYVLRVNNTTGASVYYGSAAAKYSDISFLDRSANSSKVNSVGAYQIRLGYTKP